MRKGESPLLIATPPLLSVVPQDVLDMRFVRSVYVLNLLVLAQSLFLSRTY